MKRSYPKNYLKMSINVDLEFANARIKSLEKNLLTSDKIVRLVDSYDVNDALKILAENGYGDGIMGVEADADELLSSEENKAIQIFAELMPSGYGLETFVLKNDFHNAKASYKSKISGKPNKRALKPKGLYEVDSAVESGNYDGLPLEMKSALVFLDKEKEKRNLTGLDVDLSLDQAFYKEVLRILKSSKKSVVSDYYKTLIDCTNIRSFIRCKKLNAKTSFFEKCYIEGGALTRDRYLSMYALSLDEINEKMKFTDWKEAFLVATDYLVAFETYMDNMLLRLVKKQKSEMFTPSPLLGYYLGKLCEIKVVRTILTCLKNGTSKEEIRVRIRETYA